MWSREFISIVISRTLMAIVASSYIILFMDLIRIASKGNAVAIAITPLFENLATAAVGVFSGYLLDALGVRTSVMISTISISLILLLVKYSMVIPLLYTYIFLIQTLMICFFNPALSKLLPEIVNSDTLLRANSILRIFIYTCYVIIPPLMGFLITFCNSIMILQIMAVIAFLSMIPIALVNLRISERKTEELTSSMFTKMLKGFRYIFRDSGVKSVSVAYVLVMLSSGGIGIAVNMFVLTVLKGGISAIGFITGVFTAGLICGNMVIGMGKFNEYTLLSIGIFFSGISYLTLPFSINILHLCFIYFIMGFFASFIVTPSMTIIQKLTPNEVRGRVLTSLGSLLDIATFVSTLLASILINYISSKMLILTYGLATLLVGIVTLRIFRHMKFKS